MERRQAAPLEATVCIAERSKEYCSNPLSILVVCFDDALVDELRDATRLLQWTTTVAPSEELALRLMQGESFDVVIVDIDYTATFGPAVIRSFVSETEGEPTFAVLATGSFLLPALKEQLIRAGATDVFSKPGQAAGFLRHIAGSQSFISLLTRSGDSLL